MAEPLAVWLDGVRLAIVEQDRRRLRLSYTAEALDHFSLGSPVLSLSLPLTANPYTHAVVRPFLDGLLPEGDSRRAIAADLDLLASDTFGLIAALGRDCAGALVIQPADDPQPGRPTTLTAEPLDAASLSRLVADLRSAPLGIGGRVRVSLAGVQEKLLLTQLPGGSWGRPVDGTPSTHILKPPSARFPSTVENEAFCMRLARHLGLPVANVGIIGVGGRNLLVVERYDRQVDPDGSVVRLHQEDLCQATGVPPELKYQGDGGPSLRRVAEILQAVAAPESVDALLRATTVNALIGNGDAHAKNFSMVHDPSGTIHLAPLYDLMCTMYYQDDRLAMFIDNVHRTSRVTVDRVVNEAVTWGLGRRRATDIVADVLDRAPACLATARAETDGLPDELSAVVETQLERLRNGPDG